MKIRNYIIIMMVASFVVGVMASEEKQPVTQRDFTTLLGDAVTIIPADNKDFRVDVGLAKRSVLINEYIEQEGLDRSISLPCISEKDLEALLYLAEGPLREISYKVPSGSDDDISGKISLSLDELIDLLLTEQEVGFGVEKSLFKTIASALSWDESSLVKVLNNSEISQGYKEGIVEAFVQSSEGQKAFVNNEERKWDADDLDRLSEYEELEPAMIVQLLQSLIESREGLLEEVVGFDNVHSQRCRERNLSEDECGFMVFAVNPSDDDRLLNKAIEEDCADQYALAKESLLEKYAQI